MNLSTKNEMGPGVEKHTPMMAQYVCMIFLARKYVAL